MLSLHLDANELPPGGCGPAGQAPGSSGTPGCCKGTSLSNKRPLRPLAHQAGLLQAPAQNQEALARMSLEVSQTFREVPQVAFVSCIIHLLTQQACCRHSPAQQVTPQAMSVAPLQQTTWWWSAPCALL